MRLFRWTARLNIACLYVHGFADSFLFTSYVRKFGCFNAVTLAEAEPECLNFAGLATLLLGYNELIFTTSESVEFDGKT